jgi:hypothetical protein
MTLAGHEYNFAHDWSDISNKPTIPDPVSGVNDGTNWTSITIGTDTYGIPDGKEIEYIDLMATAASVAAILTAGKWPVLKYYLTEDNVTYTYVLPFSYESDTEYAFGSWYHTRAYWARLIKSNSRWNRSEFYPVPETRTINGNALDSNVTLTPSDIGVSGVNNGTNWTSITIGSDTYGIPQGGGGSASIDNKTIVQNSLAQLETAAGG